MAGPVNTELNGTKRQPIGVAIAGLGRSGWKIHALTLRDMSDRFKVVAVMDVEAERAEQAGRDLGCRAVTDYSELIASPGVDVVVVASPSHLHTQHTLEAIAAGHSVVCEKPFALDAESAALMIEAADSAGVVLAPFQNRRYEDHYRKVRELIDAGTFGDLLQIRMCWHRFTRRWDWQAMNRFGGGALFNNGTHLLDLALPMLGEGTPEVFLDLRRGLSLGDADEHMKLVLRAETGPTIDIELTNAGAYEVDRWHIVGTGGGLRGTTERLEWRTIDWSSMPERKLDLGPAEGRLYPEETVAWEEHTWSSNPESPHPYTLFYRDLYDAVRKNRPMPVDAASALRYVEVLDRCRAQLNEATP